MTDPPQAAAAAPAGVHSRIQANVHRMSGTMTKLATLLLEEPLAPLDMSITELAARAGTSPATVTRFCRLIGYAGYVPFRVGVAADAGRIRADETWRVDIGRAFGPDDTPDEVLRTLTGSHLVALQATSDSIVLADIVRVAQAVATRSRVDIYGIGGSAFMATEAEARFYRIGINAHAWGEVHDGLTSAALLDEDSIAIAISNTGRTRETIEMLVQAKSSGALTVALTSDPQSRLATVADIHISTMAPDEYLRPDDLSAKHAQLFAIDLLYLVVAQQNFARTATTLAASAAAVAPHRRPLSREPRGAQRARATGSASREAR
ncbi:MAG: MurR/RpiR family transcriptional regulator [Actinomycetota bacterium]|nr:MurR/RpiR family transcriptional regulator [Actinomycetota bacterium]